MRPLWPRASVGFFALLVAWAAPARAHWPAGERPLQGQVLLRETGDPLPDVGVRVAGTHFKTVTDVDGRFAFVGVPEGEVEVVVEDSLIGPVGTTVPADQGMVTVAVGLATEDGPQYGTVATIRRTPPLTASTTHVSAREMRAVPRRTAEDALQLVPGFTLVQHGSEGKGHQFFLRGFDAIHGADLELTVDGVPVNEWSNIHAQGYLDLGFVIPEAVASVDVTKGPFTIDQGAFAMAGSAAYRLGIPEDERGLRGAYTLGTTNRHRRVMTYSPADGDGTQFLAAEALQDDGFGDNRGIAKAAVLGRANVVTDERFGQLAVLASAHLARFRLPGLLRSDEVDAGLVDFYAAADPAARGLSGRGLIAITHGHQGEHSRMESRIYAGYRRLSLLENYTGFLVNPGRGDRRRQAQETVSFGGSGVYDVKLVEPLVISIGGGVRGDVLDQRQEHVGVAEETLAVERDLEGLQTLWHAQLGLRYRPLPTLQLAAGGRVDVAHVAIEDGLSGGPPADGTLVAVSPRLTGMWQASETVRLLGAYGRGFRPPEARAFSGFTPVRTGIREDLFDGGEPAMTAADAVELGVRWDVATYFGARLAGFATFIARETVFDHVSGTNLELNATRRLGAEVEVYSDPTDWLSLGADATLVDARFTGSGRQVPLSPWLVGGLRAVATHPGGARAGLRFFGLAPRPLPHGARGAPMAVLDATVGYHFEHVRFDVAIENVLNARVREGEYHFASHYRPEQPASQLPVTHIAAGAPRNLWLTVTAIY